MNNTATLEGHAPAPIRSKDGLGCDCWGKTNARLKERGYKLADVCSMLTVTDDLGLHATRGVPMQRVDGAKLKRTDPRMLQISHCPFCGQKYP